MRLATCARPPGFVRSAPSLPSEIRWTLETMNGRQFVKAQTWKQHADGTWHYVDTPCLITIRSAELDAVLQGLLNARDTIKGARAPRSPEAPRGRGRKAPLPRTRAHDAPSPLTAADHAKAYRIARGLE